MKDSEKYLEALITNNGKVVKEIYTKFYPKTASFVLNNKGRIEDAQDVFQDALFYLIYIYKEKLIRVDNFEAYLFTICKNIWKRRLNHKKEWVMKENYYPLIDKTTDMALFILEQERRELYIEKFAELSTNCKDILTYYFNKMDYRELVSYFSYSSINTAWQRVFKCKKRLIQLIKNDKRY